MKIYKLILGGLCAATLFVGCNMGAKSTELVGFRATDVLDENSITPIEVDWSATPAGESQKIKRSFENAPPMIPHDLEGLIPITTDNNSCVSCHMPEVAEGVGATPVPKSHLYSIRFKQDKGGELSPDRFECTACHVGQANIEPKIINRFEADFRDANSANRSNLLDILNDGVR